MQNLKERYPSFKAFYPYYLTEHSKVGTQATHFIGTTLVIVLIFLAICLQKWWMFALLPVAGYGFAWAGHFFIEKNRPATFTFPLWSLASDFLMYYHILTFQIHRKVQEAHELIKENK